MKNLRHVYNFSKNHVNIHKALTRLFRIENRQLINGKESNRTSIVIDETFVEREIMKLPAIEIPVSNESNISEERLQHIEKNISLIESTITAIDFDLLKETAKMIGNLKNSSNSLYIKYLSMIFDTLDQTDIESYSIDYLCDLLLHTEFITIKYSKHHKNFFFKVMGVVVERMMNIEKECTIHSSFNHTNYMTYNDVLDRMELLPDKMENEYETFCAIDHLTKKLLTFKVATEDFKTDIYNNYPYRLLKEIIANEPVNKSFDEYIFYSQTVLKIYLILSIKSNFHLLADKNMRQLTDIILLKGWNLFRIDDRMFEAISCNIDVDSFPKALNNRLMQILFTNIIYHKLAFPDDKEGFCTKLQNLGDVLFNQRRISFSYKFYFYSLFNFKDFTEFDINTKIKILNFSSATIYCNVKTRIHLLTSILQDFNNYKECNNKNLISLFTNLNYLMYVEKTNRYLDYDGFADFVGKILFFHKDKINKTEFHSLYLKIFYKILFMNYDISDERYITCFLSLGMNYDKLVDTIPEIMPACYNMLFSKLILNDRTDLIIKYRNDLMKVANNILETLLKFIRETREQEQNISKFKIVMINQFLITCDILSDREIFDIDILALSEIINSINELKIVQENISSTFYDKSKEQEPREELNHRLTSYLRNKFKDVKTENTLLNIYKSDNEVVLTKEEKTNMLQKLKQLDNTIEDIDKRFHVEFNGKIHFSKINYIMKANDFVKRFHCYANNYTVMHFDIPHFIKPMFFKDALEKLDFEDKYYSDLQVKKRVMDNLDKLSQVDY